MRLNFEKIKKAWEKLIHQQATPNQIGAGFAIGLFMSFLPVPLIPTILTLCLGYFLRFNLVAALIGLHLHFLIFPIIPIIFIAEYKIGGYFLPLHHAVQVSSEEFTLLQFWVQKGWRGLQVMLIGAIILATPTSLASFWIVRQSALRWQNLKKEPSPPDL